MHLSYFYARNGSLIAALNSKVNKHVIEKGQIINILGLWDMSQLICQKKPPDNVYTDAHGCVSIKFLFTKARGLGGILNFSC